MFFNTKRIKELESSLAWLYGHVDLMEARLQKLEEAAHGLKKDGTPRAKPGRKVKQ